MKNPAPDPQPIRTLAHLVEALNQMRDEWTNASMALRDLQFELDTAQRQDVVERVKNLVNKVK